MTAGHPARPKRVSREVWLDRAAASLLEHGPSAFSMRSLAAAHGVSTQALISHFGSRDNMVRQALKRAFQRDLLVLERMLRQMSSVREFLQELVRELQRPGFLRMNATQIELFATAALKPAEHGDFATRVTKRVHAIFESQIRREGVAEENVTRIACMLVAAARGIVLEALGGQSEDELRLVAEQVIAWYEAELARQG